MKYNLSSNQADRANFDNMITEHAEGMLETLPFNEGDDSAWLQDGNEYALVAFENFELSGDEADDEEEAKARYKKVFPQAVEAWQKGRMLDLLTEELDTGDNKYIIVSPGGHKNGLAYNPRTVDVVSLEDNGGQVAYRYTDDSINEDWKLGDLEDAIDLALERRAV